MVSLLFFPLCNQTYVIFLVFDLHDSNCDIQALYNRSQIGDMGAALEVREDFLVVRYPKLTHAIIMFSLLNLYTL
jgi:hypothetical protein